MTGFVKLAMITGLAFLCWGLVFVLFELWFLWPVVGAAVTFGLVGFTAGVLLAGDVIRERVEPVQERKDIAVETAFGTAFELQERELRDSGEYQTVEPEACGCGHPAVGFDEDGPYCQRCAPDCSLEAALTSTPEAWQPAAKGRWFS